MKPAALGMAFLGLAGVLSPFVNPITWWIPSFSGLFMPVILLTNIFLLIYWSLYKKWWVIFPFITLICNYNSFSSMYQWPWKEIETNPPGKKLTIATYNVEGFYWITHNKERESFRKFINENQIDILCIQEHCEEAHLDSTTIQERISMPHRCTYFNRETSWANFGLSIYSKYPILRQGNINFNSEKNASMWADLLIEGDTIRVFNNHLQTTNVSLNREKYNKYKSIKDWKGQARTLVDIIEQLKHNYIIRAGQAIEVRKVIETTSYPAIICGDFNDTPISFAFNHIIGHNFKDGFKDCGRGYGHSFNGLKGLLRIDFIAYNSNFIPYRYSSPHLFWSDHNPVIMKLSLKKH